MIWSFLQKLMLAIRVLKKIILVESNSRLADSASQISPLTGRCFTKITVTTVVCLSLLTLAASPVVLSVFCPGPLGTES